MAEGDYVQAWWEIHAASYSNVALHIFHLAVSKQAAGEKADGWPAKSETNSSFSSVTSKHNSGLAYGIPELAEVMQLFWQFLSILTLVKHQGMNYCFWVEGLPYGKTSFLLRSHQKSIFKKKMQTYLIVCVTNHLSNQARVILRISFVVTAWPLTWHTFPKVWFLKQEANKYERQEYFLLSTMVIYITKYLAFKC